MAPRECESLHRLHFCIRGEIIIILRFERRVCRWESCRMHQSMGMWLNPNSRGSRLRIWQPWGCNSLHAHHFTATGFSGNSRPRRLKIAEPSGCKSRVADRPSLLASARQAGVWLTGKSRPIRLKIEQPWECKSPHADQIWNVNRRSEPGLFAKSMQLLFLGVFATFSYLIPPLIPLVIIHLWPLPL